MAYRSGQHLLTMIVVGQFDSPAFHQQAEDYATALEGWKAICDKGTKHSFCSRWTESASHHTGKTNKSNKSILMNEFLVAFYQCLLCDATKLFAFLRWEEECVLFFKVIQCLFPTAGGGGSLFFGGEVGKSRLFSHKGPHQDVLVNL